MNARPGSRTEAADGSATVKVVAPTAVVRWLLRGVEDLVQTGWPSLLHGVLVAAAGSAILALGVWYWPILPGAVSGFVLVGPIVATGLYALSRARARGRVPRIADAASAWRRGTRCLIVFGLLLVAAGTAWVVVSVVLFHLFVPVAIDGPLDFVRYVVTQAELPFLLWTIAGGLGASLLFALTVVSVPMLFDREIDTPSAILISIRAVGENPYTMVCWAAVIAALTALSVATLMIGFVVAYPIMGHASWHAYRDLVNADSLPARGGSC